MRGKMKVTIRNSRGERIVAAVERPENPVCGRLAFVQHGLSGHKGQVMVRRPAEAFLDNGFTVVTFDSRHSFGESDGSLEFATLSSFVEDLKTVVDWAAGEDFYHEPFALSGHSLGGGSVLRFAEEYPERVSLLVPVAAMVGGKYFIRSRLLNEHDSYRKWQREGRLYRENKNHPELNGWLSFDVVRDMLRYNLVRDAGSIRCPTLLITGDRDPSSTVYNNEKLFERLQCAKRLTILKECGHLYESGQNAGDLYRTVRDWVKENV